MSWPEFGFTAAPLADGGRWFERMIRAELRRLVWQTYPRPAARVELLQAAWAQTAPVAAPKVLPEGVWMVRAAQRPNGPIVAASPLQLTRPALRLMC